MGKCGRKKIEWNEYDAKLVESLSQYGVPQEEIAQRIGISVDTMVNVYRAEILRGRGNANANVGKRLFQKAMDGDTTALIFWAKTRLGWRETSRTEVVSPDGSMSPASPVSIDLSEMSPEDVAKMARAAFRGKA